MAKAKKTMVELPKGYKAIESGGFSPSWDFRKQPLLEGTLGKVRTIEQGKGKTKREVKVVEVTQKDGKAVTVWESVKLRPLFEQKDKAKVCVVFKGFVKIKGRSQPMKDFEVGVAGK